MRIRGVILAVILAGCATVRPTMESSGFLYVTETWEVQRLDSDKTGVLYPWEPSGDVVADACGFADFSYRAVPLERYDPHRDKNTHLPLLKVRVALGINCGMGQFIINHPSLIHVRRWGGNVYYDAWAAVYDSVAEGGELIVDMSFIKDMSLSHLLRDLPMITDAMYCDRIDDNPNLKNYDQEHLRSLENVVEHEGYLCYSRGVFLRDIVAGSL